MQIIHNPRFHDYTTFVLGHTQKIKRGCLSFKMVNPRLHGNYTLIATNEYGIANKTIPYHTMAPSKYSKTCVKRPLPKRPQIGFQYQLSLNAGQKHCICSKGSILQYFPPSLSKHLSLRPLFCLFRVAVYQVIKIIMSAKPCMDPEGDSRSGPPPSWKLQNYRLHYKYWSRPPGKSQSYTTSFQCWANETQFK